MLHLEVPADSQSTQILSPLPASDSTQSESASATQSLPRSNSEKAPTASYGLSSEEARRARLNRMIEKLTIVQLLDLEQLLERSTQSAFRPSPMRLA